MAYHGVMLYVSTCGARVSAAIDAALGPEAIRVRVGGVAGPAAELVGFGVGQGKRAGVHTFGALVQAAQALLDACAACADGVGH